MPLHSMTGFGQAEGATPSGTYRIELRSVNNRFLEMQVRQPRFTGNLEQQIRKEVSANVSRGFVTITISSDNDEAASKLSWDEKTVGNYLRIFNEIRERFDLAGEVTLKDLLSFSNIVKTGSVTFSDEDLWKHIRHLLKEAIAAFNKTREKEAAFIAKELRQQLKTIEKTLKLIEKRAPVRTKNYAQTLQEKVAKIASTEIDPARLAVEIALMADRLDISEECTRLRAHIAKFTEDLAVDEPVGKRLGFLLQEMNRESNTIGSKANDAEIGHWAVSLKEEVEKIREQIQNIE